jgi:hypothetical protein
VTTTTLHGPSKEAARAGGAAAQALMATAVANVTARIESLIMGPSYWPHGAHVAIAGTRL